MNDIYITGCGQISNLGANLPEALNKLKNPTDNQILAYLNPDSHELNQSVSYNKIHDFESKVQLSDTNSMALSAICEAVESAKLTLNDLKNKKVALLIGTTSGCTNSNPELSKNYFVDETYDFNLFENSYFNNPAACIANLLELTGPYMTINNACTAGADAIGIGKAWLHQGLCDVVIAGGAESILDNMYYGFKSLGLISKNHTKPFDKNRDGLVLGEGAGFVVLEKEQRHAKVKVSGYGTVSDPYHPTSPPPDAKGLLGSCEQALQQAGLEKTNIDLINAHATGTMTNDKIEGQFFMKHFGEQPVFATKPFTGHCLGASGALETIWGVQCIEHNFIPKTLGFEDSDEEIGLQVAQAGNTNINTYLTTSLGFGGVNSAVVLRSCQ